MNTPTKAAVSVSEMARMVGLSRARFYQLIGSAFPSPVYDVKTKRPIYDEELQRSCLEVRRRNCGIDGTPILFYARRLPTTMLPKKIPVPKASKRSSVDGGIIQGLKSLGLVSVPDTTVAAAILQVFPQGIAGVAQGEVIRSVFIHLMRQNSHDNVAR